MVRSGAAAGWDHLQVDLSTRCDPSSQCEILIQGTNMASDSQQSEGKLSSSPKEDYDPLQDDSFVGKTQEAHVAINSVTKKSG